MELPSDILPLVREFSKPLFRYRNDYAKVVVQLDREWPELKTKLSGPQADRVGRCLQAYIAAYGDHMQYIGACKKYIRDWASGDVHDERAFLMKHAWLRQECHRTLIHETVLLDELQMLVAE